MASPARKPRLADSMQAIRIQRTWKKATRFVDILQRYIDVGPIKDSVVPLG